MVAQIRFQSRVTAIGSDMILRVPKAASRKLPSRGMSMVEGRCNGYAFQAPLEPDGLGSHWFRVSNAMLRAANAGEGDSVTVVMEPMALWPEPQVPPDLAAAFASDPEARRLWMDITPLARWDWIRWIGATRNPDTRAIRIEKTLSKLRSGKRAACCFNRSQCTDPLLSRNGVLLKATPHDGVPGSGARNADHESVAHRRSNRAAQTGERKYTAPRTSRDRAARSRPDVDARKMK